ncbi:hypothetical protein DFA_07426 [Cavenderia fasciculata]|uniref:Uncharacterized protein n=1 Tax=Cavenderia fasciculata TaxID=261658 RepID=F4PWD9_CACFS|nr:uncharacterized protein DFA_07426 [Cavenderia fasciculata]EGG20303.1 hypothetical protein DFA_07426 [Cavenderia fasciculata]|eukprot:XP_004367286.1 hypothetical protein DFA_07426 [Cavenderia fasciculata]
MDSSPPVTREESLIRTWTSIQEIAKEISNEAEKLNSTTDINEIEQIKRNLANLAQYLMKDVNIATSKPKTNPSLDQK